MLEFQVNSKNLNKTKETLSVENVNFLYLDEIIDDDGTYITSDSSNKNKVLITCECTEDYNLSEGSKVIATNTLNFNGENISFVDNISICGINKDNRSFSFIIDKYYKLIIEQVSQQTVDETEQINITFEDIHYFSEDEYIDFDDIQKIPLYFRYTNSNNKEEFETVYFKYFDENLLYSDSTNFSEELKNILLYNSYDSNKTVDVYRDNFKFIGNCNYYFQVQKATVNIPLLFENSFKTDLHQADLLQDKFVEEETNKAIGEIVDLEKDIYYPVIKDSTTNTFTDVYKIKFNLHFREHRGDNWGVDSNSFWNGVTQEFDEDGEPIQGTATINKELTQDDASDLLSYLNFNNNDVYYQKNKLKKSFLRLSFYDSTNVGNQNLLDYCTIFLNSGNLFSKYIKYQDEENYITIYPDDEKYGTYTIQRKNYDSTKYKISEGIKVNREQYINKKTSFSEKKRLSTQMTIESKNTSIASSDGFYFYVWKANESVVPQDIYMKIEFNHAGFGRTVPFMLPYWDKQKHDGKTGIKTFEEIINDWNSVKNIDEKGNVTWESNKETDGHYSIKQYLKFSYIHLKYQYDKETNKHVYYLDTDTYGDNIIFPTDENGNKEIVINLFEAKIE